METAGAAPAGACIAAAAAASASATCDPSDSREVCIRAGVGERRKARRSVVQSYRPNSERTSLSRRRLDDYINKAIEEFRQIDPDYLNATHCSALVPRSDFSAGLLVGSFFGNFCFEKIQYLRH